MNTFNSTQVLVVGVCGEEGTQYAPLVVPLHTYTYI